MTQNLIAPQAEEGGYLGYYEGRMRGLPPLMVGKIFLTSKYFGFHMFEVRSAGLMGKTSLVATGKVLGISMDKIVDVSIESGVRSKKSRPNWKEAKDFERKAAGEKEINSSPRALDGSERFRQLMITHENDQGLEVAMFEVADPQLVLDKIKNLRAKPKF